jgi:hypothetical protein
MPAAEGATRPESLRQKDRGSRHLAGLTLESGRNNRGPPKGTAAIGCLHSQVTGQRGDGFF